MLRCPWEGGGRPWVRSPQIGCWVPMRTTPRGAPRKEDESVLQRQPGVNAGATSGGGGCAPCEKHAIGAIDPELDSQVGQAADGSYTEGQVVPAKGIEDQHDATAGICTRPPHTYELVALRVLDMEGHGLVRREAPGTHQEDLTLDVQRLVSEAVRRAENRQPVGSLNKALEPRDPPNPATGLAVGGQVRNADKEKNHTFVVANDDAMPFQARQVVHAEGQMVAITRVELPLGIAVELHRPPAKRRTLE